MSKEIHDAEKRLLTNLLQLQNLIKRDAESYSYEFAFQWKRYVSLLELYKMNPGTYNKEVDDLTTFLAQVSHCFKEDLKDYPQMLRDILQSHASVLDPAIRMTFVKAVILLRNKGLIDAASVLEMFFKLFRCQDKLLRKTILNYVVQDIKNINSKQKNVKLNTTLQNFMFTMMRDEHPVVAKLALDVMVELYRRNVWRNEKTVNVVATGCFSKVTKILVAALKFFLGKDPEEDKSDDEDEPAPKSVKEILLANRVAKKSRKREKKMKRALQVARKRKQNRDKAALFDTSAMRMIYDPQTFCEKLYRQLEVTNERFEVKLMMIDLASRLIGIHKLLLESFYPFIARFLQPHQSEVTKLLLYAAQASHELVPPEDIGEMLKSIANNFITDANSSDVMAVGLNAVREICARCPLGIDPDLLQDLAQYKMHRTKAVMMAARSLIQVYRQSNPELLHRKDRGKPTEATAEKKILAYGETVAHDYIPGADSLIKMEQQQQEQEEWESASEEEEDDDDDDEGWIDVHHSSDEETAAAAQVPTPQELEDRKALAKEVSSTRILTQEDFRKLQEAQLAKEAGLKSAANSKKRKRQSDTPQDRQEMPSLGDIENIHKKRAHDKDSRLATILEEREGRGKFSHGPHRMNPHASTTNKEKLRNKAFMMVKHNKRMKEKKKRSFRDKQIALRNSLVKQQMKKR